MARRVRAVFVEPYLAGSHAAFARGWISRSRHEWTLLSLAGEHWKWRLRLAGRLLGERLARVRPRPDVVVVSGLLDLAHLRQAAGVVGSVPHLLYLHENQLTYPRPGNQPVDRGFATTHLVSILSADGLALNSRFHRDALARALRDFVGKIPRPRPRGVLGRVRRARVLPPGIDFRGFPPPADRPPGDPPVIAWNHRWEEDKRPGAFARIVLRLAERGRAFRLELLGTTVQARPRPLELILERLGDRVVRAGPARTRREYVRRLAGADLAVSTAIQENFGYAALEAMAAGCVPLLPDRLSYPEILPGGLRDACLYRTDRDLLARLSAWLLEPARFAPLRRPAMEAARAHGWERRVGPLDDWVEAAAVRGRRGGTG